MFKCYIMQWGWGGFKRYEGLWFKVISITRRWGGVSIFQEKSIT